MKDNVPTLYPNSKVAEKVIDYAVTHSDTLPEPLLQYHAKIMQLEKANMTISTFQAQALSFLAKLAGAKRVLEIGVFRGFSSMVWAQAVGPAGKVTGLEVSDEYAGLSRKAFAELGFANIDVVVGDGLQTLAALDPDEPYDLVFIDAQKSGYPDYLKTLLSKSAPGSSRRLLAPGALIMADNILRRGLVADPSDDNPHAAKEAEIIAAGLASPQDVVALDAFNKAMRADPRIDVWLVPLFDGLNLGRLLD